MKYDMTKAEKSWLDWVSRRTYENLDEVHRYPFMLWKEAFRQGQLAGRDPEDIDTEPEAVMTFDTFKKIIESPDKLPKKVKNARQKDLEIGSDS